MDTTKTQPTAAAQALSGDFSVYSRTAGYILSSLTRFVYDSTTLDLVLKSLEAGAKVGATLVTPGLGGFSQAWRLTASGGGDRTPGGVWAERVR